MGSGVKTALVATDSLRYHRWACVKFVLEHPRCHFIEMHLTANCHSDGHRSAQVCEPTRMSTTGGVKMVKSEFAMPPILDKFVISYAA